MEKRVYSIGYERRTLSEFIRVLKEQGVQRVADLRNSPYSRVQGFSARELARALTLEGIEYRNFIVLGAPRKLRERSDTMSHDEFLAAYRQHFEKYAGDYELLKEFLGGDGGAIMCLERDSRECHRRVVEEELIRDGYQVVAVGDEAHKVWF